MPMTLPQLEEVTKKVVLSDARKPWNLIHRQSLFLKRFLEQKKGFFKLLNGGTGIELPVVYNNAGGQWFDRNERLSQDDIDSVKKVTFGFKNVARPVVIYWADEMANNGEEAEIELVVHEVDQALKGMGTTLAQSVYSISNDDTKQLTGLLACCNSNDAAKYANRTANEMKGDDGTSCWQGKAVSTSTPVSLDAIRQLRAMADVGVDGDGRPTLGLTTRDIFDRISHLLQLQQMFVKAEETAKAGFTALMFEGCELVVDKFCPAGHLFVVNEEHIGFGVHRQANMVRTAWADMRAGAGVYAKTMDTLWRGNLITNHRAAHAVHSALTTN